MNKVPIDLQVYGEDSWITLDLSEEPSRIGAASLKSPNNEISIARWGGRGGRDNIPLKMNKGNRYFSIGNQTDQLPENGSNSEKDGPNN